MKNTVNKKVTKKVTKENLLTKKDLEVFKRLAIDDDDIASWDITARSTEQDLIDCITDYSVGSYYDEGAHESLPFTCSMEEVSMEFLGDFSSGFPAAYFIKECTKALAKKIEAAVGSSLKLESIVSDNKCVITNVIENSSDEKIVIKSKLFKKVHSYIGQGGSRKVNVYITK